MLKESEQACSCDAGSYGISHMLLTGLPPTPKGCFTVPVQELSCFAEKNASGTSSRGRGEQFTLPLCNKDEPGGLQQAAPALWARGCMETAIGPRIHLGHQAENNLAVECLDKEWMLR